jgi:hypothetical protein
MGNTTASTISVHRVSVVSVDEDAQTVTASWNGNRARVYFRGEYSAWKVSEPVTVPTWGGMGKRLATREEKAALKAKEPPTNPPRRPRRPLDQRVRPGGRCPGPTEPPQGEPTGWPLTTEACEAGRIGAR